VVLLQAQLDLVAVLCDPAELDERARGHDGLQGRGLARERRLLHGQPVRVGRRHHQAAVLEANEDACKHRPRLVTRRGPADSRDRLEERVSSHRKRLAGDVRQTRKVVHAECVQPVLRCPRRQQHHALLVPILEHDARVGQKARDFHQEAPRHDDAAGAFDRGLERRPERQVHVGCG
jgi:hypothetical protein